MPTYTYLCLCCSKEYDVQQSIKEPIGASCPECLIWGTRRLISGGTSFTLKGGGWAADNYGSSKPSG